MTREVPPRKQAKRSVPAKADLPVDARALRAEIAAQCASDRPNLSRLVACFESLRDLTDQPARLFALAVEEAESLDALFTRLRSVKLLQAAIVAHRRVLMGDAETSRPAGIRASIASLEKLLRSTVARELSASERHLARFAVMKGLLIVGEGAAARKLLERLATDSADLPTRGAVRERARGAVYALGFELALDERDYADALRWALRRADMLAADRDAQASGAYADALAPVPSLCLEVGHLSRALEHAQSWIAAERIAMARGAERPSRLIEALQSASLAAQVLASGSSATDAERAVAVDSAARFTDAAVAATLDGEPDVLVFTRAAEAIAAETALLARVEATDAPRLATLASHARRLQNPAVYFGVQLARLSLAATQGDWRSAAVLADELLDATPEPPAGLLAMAVRAQFTLGHDRSVTALAARYLAELTRETEPAELAAVLALGSASAGREFERADPVDRDALARAELNVVHALEKRLARWPTLARVAAVRAAFLASRAMAEHRCELESLARRDAQDALTRLRTARNLAVETAAFVAYVHERVATDDARRRIDPAGLDPVSASARALAAAERDDTARAAMLLVSASLDALGAHPEALANTLAALTRTLEHLAPDDPLLAEGFGAWNDLSDWATLPGARGFIDVLGSNRIAENGVDAAGSGE